MITDKLLKMASRKIYIISYHSSHASEPIKYRSTTWLEKKSYILTS